MHFMLLGYDKPDALELRKATRPSHIDYLNGKLGKMLIGGPLLDAQGNPCGSMLVVEAASEADARAMFDEDPYVQAGLFATTTVTPYRLVFFDHEAVG
jgi:uncharacterized protein YciI